MNKLKPYPTYKSVAYDYISQLPEGWELLPNIAIFQERIERGFENEELLSVTIAKGVIKQGDVDIKKDNSNEDKSKYKLIKIGDIAYNRMRMWQGALGYSEFQGITSPAYVVLKPKTEINQRFFHYMFRTAFYTNYSKRFSYGIVDDQLSLRYVDFKRMYSIVPPLSEQNAIVAYLDQKTEQIQTFIAKKQKLIQLLEEKKKAVITKLISKGLNSNANYRETELGKIPQHWKIVNLKYLLNGKLKYGANEEAKDFDTDAPRYIRITDFGLNGELREDTFCSLPIKKAKEYLLKEGDILFARSGATVGKTFLFKSYNGLACFAGYLIKATPNEKEILSDFLFLYTKSNLYENWKNQIFNKATIENIGADKYSLLKVIVPPKEEQKQIVKKIEENVERINRAITQAQLEIEKLKEYQESLITQVVTGQVCVE